jgi:demethylmenaquinone methyltransferase/2-methoxy-6-polyprenyl-1,4-benzoquinol methylase
MVARMSAEPETERPDTERKVSFGFEEVTESEKVARVKTVFRSVASRYDLMNDLMSAGDRHRVRYQ